MPENTNTTELSAADRAEALFRKGASCSQAVVLAFTKEYNLPQTLVAKLTLGLGGGVCRKREICGAVAAMAVLAGIAEGEPQFSAEAKARTYEVGQRMMDEFKSRFSSYICRELLARSAQSAANDSTPAPDARTEAYYKARRSCIDNIRAAAQIAEKTLLKK